MKATRLEPIPQDDMSMLRDQSSKPQCAAPRRVWFAPGVTRTFVQDFPFTCRDRSAGLPLAKELQRDFVLGIDLRQVLSGNTWQLARRLPLLVVTSRHVVKRPAVHENGPVARAIPLLPDFVGRGERI
jgi:hypothetical protein